MDAVVVVIYTYVAINQAGEHSATTLDLRHRYQITPLATYMILHYHQ